MARVVYFIFCIILSTSSASQTAPNHSDRYNDAYKKYLDASCPVPEDSIQHFVYFARDRELILNHPLLHHPMLGGAQIMYSWSQLEPEEGHYDFTMVKEDYGYLKRYGKKLFIQIQDATFSPKYKAVPGYLQTGEYDGGHTMQHDDAGKPLGWVAKRWNKNVGRRFALFLGALGKEFDGKIEGINLQETAIGMSSKSDTSFSEERYLTGLKANMLALKKAFPSSTKMIYANFMPGEFLPWTDKGYLREIYRYGEEIGVGLGGPDLMVTRTGQLNNALALMHEGKFSVPIGIAIQDGNYTGKTGADHDYNEDAEKGKPARKTIVPLLHAFAKDFLRVRYMFWANQAPYFEEDVLPCFSSNSGNKSQ